MQRRAKTRLDTLKKLNIRVDGVFFRKEKACKKYGKIRLYLGVPEGDPWLEARKCPSDKTFVRPLFWNSGPTIIKDVPTKTLISHGRVDGAGKGHFCPSLL